jgi:hypothetical protein
MQGNEERAAPPNGGSVHARSRVTMARVIKDNGVQIRGLKARELDAFLFPGQERLP